MFVLSSFVSLYVSVFVIGYLLFVCLFLCLSVYLTKYCTFFFRGDIRQIILLVHGTFSFVEIEMNNRIKLLKERKKEKRKIGRLGYLGEKHIDITTDLTG